MQGTVNSLCCSGEAQKSLLLVSPTPKALVMPHVLSLPPTLASPSRARQECLPPASTRAVPAPAASPAGEWDLGAGVLWSLLWVGKGSGQDLTLGVFLLD